MIAAIARQASREPTGDATTIDAGLCRFNAAMAACLAVMALVEKGAVKLDAPLGRYVSDFRRTAYNQATGKAFGVAETGVDMVEKALREQKLSLDESRLLLKFYESGLEGYTYLE